MHSGLEHAAAVLGQLLSAGRTFLPHTVARTASEHLLRAQHLIDPTATPDERRRRRLNEWAYAAIESDYRRQGRISSALNTAEWVDPDEPLDMGKSKEGTPRGDLRASDGYWRGSFSSKANMQKLPRVEGTEGRLSTMRLAELYTAGEASGIPSFTMRGHSAATHGTEIGILGHFADDSPEDPSLGGVIVPRPESVGRGFNCLQPARGTPRMPQRDRRDASAFRVARVGGHRPQVRKGASQGHRDMVDGREPGLIRTGAAGHSSIPYWHAPRADRLAASRQKCAVRSWSGARARSSHNVDHVEASLSSCRLSGAPATCRHERRVIEPLDRRALEEADEQAAAWAQDACELGQRQVNRARFVMDRGCQDSTPPQVRGLTARAPMSPSSKQIPG